MQERIGACNTSQYMIYPSTQVFQVLISGWYHTLNHKTFKKKVGQEWVGVTYGPCINQNLCINIYLDGHGVVEHHRDVLEHFVSWVFNEHYGVAAYNHGVVVIK